MPNDTTIHLLVKLWPILVFLLMIAAGASVALYRVGENSVAIKSLKRCLFRDDGELVYMTASDVERKFYSTEDNIEKNGVLISACMTKEQHGKDCKLAGYEIEKAFNKSFDAFQEKLLTKMADQNKPVIEILQEHSDMIRKLDRRTRHLKDSE